MLDMFHDPAWGKMRDLFNRFPKVAAVAGSLDVADSADSLPSTCFADPNARLFPIHEKRAAVLSYAYAREQTVPRFVMNNIKEALAAYDVDESTFEQQAVKTAAPLAPEECLFPATGSWPIRTAGEVKTAEAALHQEHAKLLPDARVEAYGRLYKRAQELGVALDATSHKYAGFVETDTRELRDSLRARAIVAEKRGSATIEVRTKIAAAYEKIAATLDGLPRTIRNRPQQVKLASAIAELDEHANVTTQYDRGVPDPVKTVFNTDKIARGDDIELGGKMFAISKLASLPASFYKDALGEDFASELAPGGEVSSQKLAQILPTLPYDMKRSLEVSLRSTGR